MTFNDTTSLNGLIQDCEFICNLGTTGISGNATLLKDFTRFINEGYGIVAHLIIQSDGRMQWDDSNHTDQPISTTDLVTNQENYNVFSSAPTALQDWLTIERVEVLDESDNAYKLKPFDKNELDVALTEFMDSSSTPIYFDFNGTSIILKPASDYNKTSGLKIYFQREPSYFASTDTSKRPGFATMFHSFLSNWASYKWATVFNQQLANRLRDEIGSLEKNRETGMAKRIVEHYSKRPAFEKPVLRRKDNCYK